MKDMMPDFKPELSQEQFNKLSSFEVYCAIKKEVGQETMNSIHPLLLEIRDNQSEIKEAQSELKAKIDPVYSLFIETQGWGNITVSIFKTIIIVGAAIASIYAFIRWMKQ